MGSSGNRVLRASLGVLILLGFLWFLFVCLSVNRATTITVRSSGNSKLLKLIETESKHAVHRDYGLNYVSKRRVPNGPDPIHNRLARKYRQPPGRVLSIKRMKKLQNLRKRPYTLNCLFCIVVKEKDYSVCHY